MADTGEWLLKIISGPHQGAEVPLPPGRAVVGSHAECDVVLHDVLIAPQHFALVLDSGALALEPIEGAVFCNGKRATARTTVVPAFAFITAGTTHVVVGPADARWPLLSLGDVPPIEKEPPPAPVETPAAAATEEPDATSAGGKKSPAHPTKEQRRRAWWTAGIGGVLLIVWLVLWATFGPRTPAPAPLSAHERAEQVLRAFPDAKAVRLEQRGDRLVATGYVASDSAQRELASALREDAPEVSLRIWSTPRMLETARSLLAARGLPLEVSAVNPGELQVRGTVKNRDEWQAARKVLLGEVPGLVRIDDDIISIADAAPASTVTAPPPKAVLIEPATIRIVALQELGNGQGWLRLSTGLVLFRGAELPGGGRIVSFNDGQAVVEDEGRQHALGLGMSLGGPPAAAAPAEAAPSPGHKAPPSVEIGGTPAADEPLAQHAPQNG